MPPGKTSSYVGTEAAATKPVDEATQAAYYQQAMQIAFCQPTVAGLLLFHYRDEREMPTWQSGVYYADGTPKSSITAVRDAFRRTRGGSIARCEGLALDVVATQVKFPTKAGFKRGERIAKFRCSLDCIWTLRTVRVSDGVGTARQRGYARAGVPAIASLKGRRIGTQPVKLTLTVIHPVNPGRRVGQRERRALAALGVLLSSTNTRSTIPSLAGGSRNERLGSLRNRISRAPGSRPAFPADTRAWSGLRRHLVEEERQRPRRDSAAPVLTTEPVADHASSHPAPS